MKNLTRIVALVVLFAVTVVYAGAPKPVPYTIDTQTGLQYRSTESSLYNAVWRIVQPLVKAYNLNEAEKECAKASVAEKLLDTAFQALRGYLNDSLEGYTSAQDFFRQNQDDWCNKSGGMRGLEVAAPYAASAGSFIRPFLKDELTKAVEGIKVRPLTAAEVAAIIAAALLAAPVLAPL